MRRAEPLEPTSSGPLERSAAAAELAGRNEEAVRLRRACWRQQPGALAAYRLASALARAGLDEAAAAWFGHVRELTDEPDLIGKAEYHLAGIHCRAKRWERSIEALKSCISRVPSHRSAVELLERLRRTPEAWAHAAGAPVYVELDGPGTLWESLYGPCASGGRSYRAVFPGGTAIDVTQTRERSFADLRGPTELGRYARIESWLQPCWRVLDVAAGSGYGSAWLAARVKQVVSVERDVAATRFAAIRHGLRHACVADACALPFAGETFDLVISVETLEHVVRQVDFAESVHRLLVPGGIWYLTTPPVGASTSPFHPAEVNREQLCQLLRRVFGKAAVVSWMAEGDGPRGFEVAVRRAS